MIREHEVIKKLVAMLKESKTNTKVLKVVILCIDKLLKTDPWFVNDEGPRLTFETEGGVDILEDLQTSPNTEIFSLCQRVLKEHYPEGEEHQMSQQIEDGEMRF